jgi:hypothetical protein
MFRCRLWTRCLFTFTKLPISQSRYGVSSLDKASTTSRSELIPKRVKPYTASSLAVTVSSSAADRPGLQSVLAARIRTDLRCRTLISTRCSLPLSATFFDNRGPRTIDLLPAAPCSALYATGTKGLPCKTEKPPGHLCAPAASRSNCQSFLLPQLLSSSESSVGWSITAVVASP